jgi:hypothetical protein
MDEILPREVKKPPILVVNGVAIGVARVEDWESALGAAFTVVSTFHKLRVPAGDVASLASYFIVGSIFHILNAPHPDAGFCVSASSPVVMVGIGGSRTGPESLADGCVSAMNSRNAFAQVSDASRASLASDSWCRVSSNSAFTAFISRRRSSISSTRGSLVGKSSDSGDEVRAKMLEMRLELTGGWVADDWSDRLSVCAFGLGLIKLWSDIARVGSKKLESDMEETRLWPFMREPPANEMKDARLFDDGVGTTDMVAARVDRRFSVCSLIKPRLR